MEEAVNNIPKEQERWRKKDLKQHTSEVARDKVPHATAERERFVRTGGPTIMSQSVRNVFLYKLRTSAFEYTYKGMERDPKGNPRESK